MFTAALRSLVLLWCISCVLGQDSCPTYKNLITPTIKVGAVDSLRRFFQNDMNEQNRSIVTYRLLPIDNTVWPEDSAMKMLISLSKPLLGIIGESNRWPENNNIRVYYPGPANVLKPSNSYHAGIRYIYNCETLQTISCWKGSFEYHQNRPILNRYSEEIFVPIENMVAANGDAMANHLSENNGFYYITDCNKIAVKECGSRQVFYNATNSADDCVFSLKYFSLPENIVAKSVNEDTSDPNKYVPQSLSIEKQYFIVMY